MAQPKRGKTRPRRSKPAAASAPRAGRAGMMVFGAIQLPPVADGETTSPAIALVFIAVGVGEAPLVVGPPHVVREVTAETVAAAWRDLVAELARHGDPPPRQVRTASEPLAASLRAVGGEALTVEVGRTPELAALRATMERVLRHGVSPSYFHGEAFSSELIRGFFVAALAYRQIRPWELLAAEEFIDLDAPALGLGGAALSVITDDGYGGLQLHRRRDAFVGLDPMREEYQEALGRGSISVMFYARRQLPDLLRDELRRLPFAPATGPVPAILAADEHGRSRPLTRDDYLTITACLEALTRFIADHGEHIEARTMAPTVDEFEVVRDGQPVTIRLHLQFLPTRTRTGAVSTAGIAGSGPRPSPRSVHRLRVTLRDTRPPIWRRLEVPSTMTLAELHVAIQIAMGWQSEHLHAFNHKGREIGPVDTDRDSACEFDEAATELWAVVPAAGDTLRYTYDFGDDWIHDIEVERVSEAEAQVGPRCLDGRRAGPPEDCGGPWGLERLLRTGRDTDDEREVYDPANFSVAEVNARLGTAFAERTVAG